MKRLSLAAAMATWLLIGPINESRGAGDAGGHPLKEDTYTITSVIQVLQPFSVADMNDDFQDARVLSQDKDSCTVEITYYPLYRPPITENANWRKDDAGMMQYLKPTATENWDEKMRRDVVAELLQSGINPDIFSDRELVAQVSDWAMHRTHSTDAFSVWCVYFPDGKPAVFPPLREAFEHQKRDSSWTDENMFHDEVLGAAMYHNKIHGACTSSSIYLATVLRALGIPTRIVFCIPPFDPNDEAQAKMFYENIHNNFVRETVREALIGVTGFDDHMFNEVYIGHRWVRLNYSKLDQPVLDSHYFGLLTHIYTSADMSQVPLAQTWGMRCFKYPGDQPPLSSINPYRLISIQDHFGANAHLDNPPVPPAELQTATIIGLYFADAPQVPKWAADAKSWQSSHTEFMIATKEYLPGIVGQMRAFEKRVGHEFLLTSPGHPDVRARLSGLKSSSGDGVFQAYGAQVLAEDKEKIEAGAPYTIVPKNTSQTYRWVVDPSLAPMKFKEKPH